MNKYQVLGACGEGFYGTVFKGRHRSSDTLVAIKQFKQKEDYATKREIETLSKLKHRNIIDLREVFREQGKLHMVFEFLDTDLLNALGKFPKGMPEKLVRIYMAQLCKALDYCHQRGVVHRDLKPENLLVSGSLQKPDPSRSLKLCDFGEARNVGPADQFLSGIIGTRWYRAPEILVGAKVATQSKSNDASSFNKVTRPKLLRYDFQVDMWGVGCIMGEILLANPMFPADTDIQQLEMVQVYGTPAQLTKRFSGKCSPKCVSAVKAFLELSPKNRLKACTALQHQFFAGRAGNNKKGRGPVDSYSVSHTHNKRPKFQPQFSHGELMDDVMEEIDTESDNDDMELPEDDCDVYDADYEDCFEEKIQHQPPQQSSSAVADDNYSDDEFDAGYSDDEFEDIEDYQKETIDDSPVTQKLARKTVVVAETKIGDSPQSQKKVKTNDTKVEVTQKGKPDAEHNSHVTEKSCRNQTSSSKQKIEHEKEKEKTKGSKHKNEGKHQSKSNTESQASSRGRSRKQSGEKHVGHKDSQNGNSRGRSKKSENKKQKGEEIMNSKDNSGDATDAKTSRSQKRAVDPNSRNKSKQGKFKRSKATKTSNGGRVNKKDDNKEQKKAKGKTSASISSKKSKQKSTSSKSSNSLSRRR